MGQISTLGEAMLAVDLVLQFTGREHCHYDFCSDYVLRPTEHHLHPQAVGAYIKSLAPRSNGDNPPDLVTLRKEFILCLKKVVEDALYHGGQEEVEEPLVSTTARAWGPHFLMFLRHLLIWMHPENLILSRSPKLRSLVTRWRFQKLQSSLPTTYRLSASWNIYRNIKVRMLTNSTLFVSSCRGILPPSLMFFIASIGGLFFDTGFSLGGPVLPCSDSGNVSLDLLVCTFSFCLLSHLV